MAKRNNGNDAKVEKGGYRPLNVGYSAKEQRGYVPTPGGAELPKAPIGGSGQSTTGRTGTSKKHKSD